MVHLEQPYNGVNYYRRISFQDCDGFWSQIVQSALWHLMKFVLSWLSQVLINSHIVRDLITTEDTYSIHWWHWLLYTLTSDLSSRASTYLSYHRQAETLILLKMTYHNPLLFSSLYILDFPSYFSWHKVLYPFLILHHTFTCLLNSFWKSNLPGQKKPWTNKTILISS